MIGSELFLSSVSLILLLVAALHSRSPQTGQVTLYFSCQKCCHFWSTLPGYSVCHSGHFAPTVWPLSGNQPQQRHFSQGSLLGLLLLFHRGCLMWLEGIS